MKKGRKISLRQKISFYMAIGGLLIIPSIIGYGVYVMRKEAIAAAEEQTIALADKYSKIVQARLEVAIDASRALADALSIVGEEKFKGSLSREQAIAMGKKILHSDKDFWGLSIAFEPNAFDGNDVQFMNTSTHDATGRFLPHLTKTKQGEVDIEVLRNYESKDNASWYWEPKNQLSEYLTEPFVHSAHGNEVNLISCVAPIIHKDTFIGVVGLDFTIDFMQKLVSKGDYYDGNFQLSIVSHDGNFVANKNFPHTLGKDLKEIFPDDYNEQLNYLQNGKEHIIHTDSRLKVYEPLYVGKNKNPWQIRFTVPYSYIVKHADELKWNQITIGLIILILGTLASFLNIGRLLKPLEQMVVFANTIASGDLKTEIDVKSKNDEIGDLHNAFLSMKKKLLQIVSEIKIGTEQISGASNQVSSTSMQLSNAATEQASSIEEVSSTMEEIASNVASNTSNAQLTSTIADKSSKGIQIVSDAGNNSQKSISDISEKISIINDIAVQTNILALNAAVEAARAGDSGRGFAVVAGEVRNLAELSKKAADEIIVQADNSVSIANNAGDTIAKVMPEIEKTAALLQEITAASIEQSSGVEQVNNAMQQLNNLTQQNASVSEELASSAEELSSQAQNLEQLIAFFKV
ncbi:MAG: methyl-accepting chemotaxis protein [Carboxylicivirga sp.]|jgi:methyl-accepting chemotaxis protein|nr:methyl-accepting chemotaxis protein [Carboxylicivirga sp.]